MLYFFKTLSNDNLSTISQCALTMCKELTEAVIDTVQNTQDHTKGYTELTMNLFALYKK